MEPAEASPDRRLTRGEVLEKLFMDNADRGANAANDELVEVTGCGVRGLFGVVCTSFFVRRRSGLRWAVISAAMKTC